MMMMMKAQRDEIDTMDELELAIETLKDLTPTAQQADAIRGGRTTSVRACYCGTM